MTEAEIIKALEYAVKIGDSPIGEHWGCIITKLTAKEALDLINRQKAEIEKCVDTLCKKEDMTQLIAKERNQYYDELQLAKAEIERLQEEHKSLEEAYREQENYEDMIIEGVEVCSRCHEQYAEKNKTSKSRSNQRVCGEVEGNE